MAKVNSRVQVISKYGDHTFLTVWIWGLICFMTWLPVNLADAADSINVIAQHDRNSSQYNENCTSCHADVLLKPSSNNPINTLNTAHFGMLPYAPGESDNTKCVFCHHSTELIPGLPQPSDPAKGSIRRPVDSALCSLCHGPSGPNRTPAAKQFYLKDIGNLPAYNLSNPNAGKALYETICSGCHNSLANSEVKGESANEIRKEINENEGGMGPLKVLTDAQLNAISNALSQ